MDSQIGYMTATSLQAAYASGDLSPVEAVLALRERIERLDGDLNAMTATCFGRSLHEARHSEKRYRDGNPRPLEGVPIAIKDLIDTGELRTAYGSKIFDDHIPKMDAPVVSRARLAGGIVIGKTATHEFAWGITTANEHFGPTRNPWMRSLVPGGSSGGSAAAVAAGFAPLALGTDTAGSIRIPAAFCGIVGLKPTHGAVSTSGVFPLAPSLDHVGPMARSIADLRMLLSVLTGSDYLCSDTRADRDAEVVVGICDDLDQVPLTSQVWTAREAAAETLARSGLRVVRVSAESLPSMYKILGTTVAAEGAWVHRKAGLWPDREDEYSADVRLRLRLAGHVDLDDYIQAQQDRLSLRSTLERIFSRVDVLLSPVSAVSPATIEDADITHNPEGLTEFREQVMTSTALQSLTGFPACVVRAGFDAQNVPIGVQLTAPPNGEYRLLEVAQRLFDATAEIQEHWPKGCPVNDL
ncbi:amidase [Streptomyces sp. NPDC006668]|uniref:amidase n=1 Tax=Streptomyces sp. NPDC006668 TaxID=3156903 RepID=UPI0033F4C0C7